MPGFAFFTRKGTLEDVLAALDSGAVRVIKKPDPNEDQIEGRSLDEAYDSALRDKASDVRRDIDDAINRSSWLWKHRAFIEGILVGFVSSMAATIIYQVIAACLKIQ